MKIKELGGGGWGWGSGKLLDDQNSFLENLKSLFEGRNKFNCLEEN